MWRLLLAVSVATLVRITVELPPKQGDGNVPSYATKSRIAVRTVDGPKPVRDVADRSKTDFRPKTHVDFSMAQVVALTKEDGELVWMDLRFMNETHGSLRTHHRTRPFSATELLASLAPAVILGMPLAVWTVWATNALRRDAMRKDDY